ncbi:MAG: hypothetical protein KBD56_05495 [Candidatus Eisenbacteria bacterium]|nr:hypothetical protein [Candidatus Eisenbacteria bacterium]
MRTMLAVGLLVLVTGNSAFGCEGRSDGGMLAKVAAVEQVREGRAPWTIYTVVVCQDSSYIGRSAARGDSITLWTPGGGPTVAFLDGPNPLETIAMVVGEKVFVFYRELDGRRFVVDKWTVWRRGAVRAGGNARERRDLAEEDARLEAMLGDPVNARGLPDSLEVFHTAWNDNAFLNPVPGPGVTWRDYGLLGQSEGTLRSILEESRGRGAQ